MKKALFQMSGLGSAFEEAMAKARADDFMARLLGRDATLWKEGERERAQIGSALGWLGLPGFMAHKVDEIEAMAGEVSGAGFTEAVLLGMGGSSLAPLVMAGAFGNAEGYPRLTVLDSTDPLAVERVRRRVTRKTLFIVSSKSGSTVEPNTLFRFFYSVMEGLAPSEPGANFIAITDPGSSLEALSREYSFRHLFLNPPDVGGRFSALSFFGLVPAAISGVDIRRLLAGATRGVEAGDEEGLRLGAALGSAALAGRDKVTLFTSGRLPAFGLWVEQLLAESTGKEGRGLLPVTGEPLGMPKDYGADRVFVDVRVLGDEAPETGLRALRGAGHPIVRITLEGPYDLGYEFMRWEVATALVGRMLGINPFDQPDVEAAKVLARARLQEVSPPPPGVLYREGQVKVYLGERALHAPGVGKSLEEGGIVEAISALLESMRDGEYLALLTYYSTFDAEVEALRAELQALLMRQTRHAVQAGFGPRYLHSTGQIHKGGPNEGVFLIFTHAAPPDIEVPGLDYTFSELELSQAYGDMEALTERGRRALLFETNSPTAEALDDAMDIVRRAVS